MSRLSRFPPDFDPTLPSREETPHYLFFPFTKKFLFQKPRNWDFSKQKNVHLFNQGLTKAFHKDIDHAKGNFESFRERLMPVEKAFESLYKAHRFFEHFTIFADKCLVTNFQYPHFKTFVQNLKKWVDRYVLLLKSYKYFETPHVKWPSPQVYTELRVPIRPPEPMENVIDIDTLANLDENLVIIAWNNYQLAIELLDQLEPEYLQPPFKQLATWLAGSQCFFHIRKQLNQMYDALIYQIQERQASYGLDIEDLHYLIESGTYDDVPDLNLVAAKSIRAVEDAFSNRLVLELQNTMMLKVVLKVYDHALAVLKPFKALASSGFGLSPSIGRHAHGERLVANYVIDKWVLTLEMEKSRLLESRTLTHYLQNLPQLYPHIAQHSFINCGTLHDL